MCASCAGGASWLRPPPALATSASSSVSLRPAGRLEEPLRDGLDLLQRLLLLLQVLLQEVDRFSLLERARLADQAGVRRDLVVLGA